jgi:thioredoxin 1
VLAGPGGFYHSPADVVRLFGLFGGGGALLVEVNFPDAALLKRNLLPCGPKNRKKQFSTSHKPPSVMGHKAIEITDANFDQIINSDKPVLVDFWAEWCGPCRMVGPVVEELAGEYEGKVIIGKVDVDANPQTSAKFGIRSIPTLLVFKNGQVVDKQVGAVPKHVLAQKLDAQVTA